MAILEAEPHELEDSEQNNEAKFSVRDITSLVINSYRLSQGQPSIQKEFFAYLVKNYGNLLDADTVKQAEPFILQIATKIVGNSKLHSVIEDDVEAQLAEDLEMLYRAIDQRPAPNLIRLALMMVGRDQRYLELGFDTDNDGYEHIDHRPREAKPNHHTHATDPRLSQYVYYVLMNQTDNFPEPMRRMLKDTQLAAENIDDKDFIYGVESLVKIHIKSHPEQINLLPEKYRSLV